MESARAIVIYCYDFHIGRAFQKMFVLNGLYMDNNNSDHLGLLLHSQWRHSKSSAEHSAN